MICKDCRKEINKEESYDEESGLCFKCFEIKTINENAQEIIPFLLKHHIEFKKVNFGSGEGFYLDLGEGVVLKFFENGYVCFEYDEGLKEGDLE